MDDLVTWLRAQLDADERAARAWLPLGNPTAADRRHIARHDPARVLAEAERTRKLIRRYELAAGASTALVSFTRGQDDGYRQACEDAIRDAAEVYADRPGYREDWAPDA